MSAKLGFAAGLAVGVLAGSRAGRGLYDKSAAAASAVVHDPRVRSGASSALHRAGSAGSTVAGAAARKVTGKGKGPKEEGEGEGEGGGEGGSRTGAGSGGDGDRSGVGEFAGRGRSRRTGESRIGALVAGESRSEHRVRMKRLMGGVRGQRRGGVDESGGFGQGQVGASERGSVFGRHSNHDVNHSHSSAVSAPSVQVKPKGEADEAKKDEGGEG